MGFINNLGWRYATKKFDGRKLSAGELDKIITAIQMAPSSFGLQPYHVSVVGSDQLKKLTKLHPWSRQQIKTCSHLLVFSVDLDLDRVIKTFLKSAKKAGRKDVADDPKFDYGAEAKKFAKKMGAEWQAKQAYIALGFALAACAELKIDSCPIEAFNFSSLKEFLNLPKNLEPKVLLVIGYRSFDDAHSKDPKIRADKKDLFDVR